MLQMSASHMILDLMRWFKCFIEVKCKDRMILHMFTCVTVKETKFAELEEAKKEKELFT